MDSLSNYWNKMVQFKYELVFSEIYKDRTIRINRFFRTILAISSSSAIAVWAIWQRYPFIWAAIIAICQILSIVYDQIPYQTRILECEQLIRSLEKIYIEMERDWWKIQNADDSEVDDLCYKYVNRWSETSGNFNAGDNPVISGRVRKIANEETDAYFERLK